MTDTLNLQIEIWDIDDIKPYPGNAKIHPPEQVEALASVMLKMGYDQPIVVEADGTIIKGHGRRLAALHNVGLGHEKFRKVPVVVRRDLDKAAADAARMSDNRVSSTLYDTELLQEGLAALNALEFDLKGLGFDDKELSFLTADLGDMDLDAFVDDIGTAVDTQKKANDAKVKEIDERRTGDILKGVEPDDLMRFGLIPEFIGRLPIIAHVDDLDRDSMVRVLTEPKNSLVKQYQRLFAMDGAELTISAEALGEIADKAAERKTGARGLRAIMEEVLLPVMFDLPTLEDAAQVIVEAECVTDGVEPQILMAPDEESKSA